MNQLPSTWNAAVLQRYRKGIYDGQMDAEWGNCPIEVRKGKLTAYELGYRTAYSKRLQRLHTGRKEQKNQPRTGKERVRENSVVVRYDTGEKYTITNVLNVTHTAGGCMLVTVKDAEHWIPLRNKDVVTYYRAKPKLKPRFGADPGFTFQKRN